VALWVCRMGRLWPRGAVFGGWLARRAGATVAALARATGGRCVRADWVECWSVFVASFCMVTAGGVLMQLATFMGWFFWPEPRYVFAG